MLNKKRCKATGVVNFYVRGEPHLAVATAVVQGTAQPVIWHYHGESSSAAGVADDLRTVERAVNEHHSRALRKCNIEQRAA